MIPGSILRTTLMNFCDPLQMFTTVVTYFIYLKITHSTVST